MHSTLGTPLQVLFPAAAAAAAAAAAMLCYAMLCYAMLCYAMLVEDVLQQLSLLYHHMLYLAYVIPCCCLQLPASTAVASHSVFSLMSLHVVPVLVQRSAGKQITATMSSLCQLNWV